MPKKDPLDTKTILWAAYVTPKKNELLLRIRDHLEEKGILKPGKKNVVSRRAIIDYFMDCFILKYEHICFPKENQTEELETLNIIENNQEVMNNINQNKEKIEEILKHV